MSDASIAGIHHVTALSGAAQENLDFYAGVLGLRLVKTTVNFDDPTTHHLYYGNTVGRPGTVLTFFPWPRATQGRPGAGMVRTVAFDVPEGTLADWKDRLADVEVAVEEGERFGESFLRLRDPNDLSLELIASSAFDEPAPWADGPVPEALVPRGFHAPTLPVFTGDRTLELFEEVFGWTQTDEQEGRVRFRAPDSGVGSAVDLQVRDRHPSGRMGQGAVHHIAFRARDAEEQAVWQEALRERDIQVTDVKDRQYFQSIYFRDPDWTSGILFEIATDGPGFLVDESEEELGRELKLPPWLETRRDELERALPSLARPRAEP